MTNDMSQPIGFVLFGNHYQFIVKYPKSHYSSFINDLILFGQTIKNEEPEVVKNVQYFVVNYWQDRMYEIELV